MKFKRLRNVIIVFLIIIVLFSSNSVVVAQPKDGSHTKGLIHLQFVITVSWSASDLQQPISPGETREVHLTIESTVTRGLYGRILLHLLEGQTYPIRLSIEDKPDWCTAWTIQENLTGIILSDEICIQNTVLYIHLNNDAPTNYTLGWVKVRCTIDDKKGPFNIITLIHGFEQKFTLVFNTSP